MTGLQDIFLAHHEEYLAAHAPSAPQIKAINAIMQCRTAALGGHSLVCGDCGHIEVSYNSCRNRHCPKCQTVAKEQWIDRQGMDMLDTRYFHVVFTLPSELGALAYANQQEAYACSSKPPRSRSWGLPWTAGTSGPCQG